MGGLVGSIGRNDDESARKGLDVLSHRMPGVEGVFSFPEGFLQGFSDNYPAQPWRRDNWLMVCDVDVYDLSGLESKLADQQVEFEKDNIGDTLLAGFQLLGEELFSRLKADFAAALYNSDTGDLLLVRDRAGTRPLYYWSEGGQVVFASEYKAILAQLDGLVEPDPDVLQYLHSRKMVPAEKTLVRGVYQVPPQSIVRFSAAGETSISTYWEPRLDVQEDSLAEYSEQLEKTFLAAVQRRADMSERVVVSLSGGIDSIAILGALRHLEPGREIFTITVADAPDDPELVWAEKIARHYNANHQSIVLETQEIFGVLPELVWHLEDPIARTETLMCYVLAERASKIAPVILRGDGADGLFGGMPRHRLVAKAARWPMIKWLVDDLYGFSQTGQLPSNPLTAFAIKLLLRKKIPDFPKIKGARKTKPQRVLSGGGPELLNRLLVSGPKHVLPMLLQKMERVHSAHGVRCVSPFLDADVMGLANRVPSRFKNDGRQNKIVLREAIRGFVPDEFRSRPKHPQRVRESAAFCDALASLAEEYLTASAVSKRGVYYWEQVQRLVLHERGEVWAPEHAMRVWTLVLVELWYLQFAEKEC